MYKLLITDVDGTLVNTDDRISEKNLQALKDAKLAGIQIAICTGRSTMSSLRHIDTLGLNGYHGFLDGAYICNHRSRNILHSAPIDPKYVGRLIRFAGETSIYLELCDGLHSFALSQNPIPRLKNMVYETKHIIGPLDKISSDHKIIQAMMIANDPAAQDRIMGLETEIGTDLQFIKGQLPPNKSATFCEVLNSGVTKADVVVKLSEYYGIAIEETMAVGDWRNDTAMLSKAGLGVAMGNAPDDVKAAADRVTAHVDEDGLAKAIYDYLF